MTTIDTTIDAPVDPSQLAGTSTSTIEASDEAVASMPAIAADYYNLTEDDGWPVAGLLVMLDRHQQPVRAEVHLYDNTLGRRQDDALHNANRLLITKYWSPSEEESRVPLRVMRTRQDLDTLTVQLNVNERMALSQADSPSWLKRNQVLLGTFALFLVAAVTLGVLAMQGSLGTFVNPLAEPRAAEVNTIFTMVSEDSSQTSDPAYIAAMTGGNYVPATVPVQPQSEVILETVVIEEPKVKTVSVEESLGPLTVSTETYINPYAFESNSLAPSGSAFDFSLLDRAFVSATALAVQTEASPEADFSIHWLKQGTQVKLLGGPIWKEGQRDTIVWWFGSTDDGKEGWMAANGGDGVRYLEPAP